MKNKRLVCQGILQRFNCAIMSDIGETDKQKQGHHLPGSRCLPSAEPLTHPQSAPAPGGQVPASAWLGSEGQG